MSARVTIEQLESFCVDALKACDVGEDNARATAALLAFTDSWGVFTHGSKLLIGYAKRLTGKGLKGNGTPSVVREGPSWALVDGGSTLGQVTSTYAMQLAIEKAKEAGTAYVGVRNSCHFGAAGVYANQAAQQGMIGMAMANDVPSVAAPGSRNAVTGSNPMAYGVPTGGHPILLDMAISTVAGGKVFAACERGEPLPDNWVIGPDGLPTNDGSGYPESSSLAPMAGYKGYGIALLIETVSAVLTGASMTQNVGSWLFDDPGMKTDHGGAFLAINVSTLMPLEVFQQRIDGLIEEIHAAPKAGGSERIYLPGEKEWEKREEALKVGISLPSDVIQSLRRLSKHTGVAAPDWL